MPSARTQLLESGPPDEELRALIVRHGLASAEKIDACVRRHHLQLQQAGGARNSLPLGDLLVAGGVLSRRQLEELKVEVERAGFPQIPGYEVLGKLGAGANATVYKARQLSLDRFVAIKVLPRGSTRRPRFVERFYAEGRAAAALNHPNIVGALDVGQAGDRHYFVMEYVKGRTVHEDLLEATRYDEDEAVRIALQVARGLKHAHDAGLIHRDVKPMNIILTDEGGVKLADLGLARQTGDAEAANQEKGKSVGTPFYMSPEQVRSQPDIDPRTDLYSLGATLYYMVTGQVPFDAATPSGVMRQHLTQPVIPPRERNPRISEDLNRVILVCLAKNREDRYDTADELIHDLEALLHGEPPLYADLKLGAHEDHAAPAPAPRTPTSPPPASVPAEVELPLYRDPLFWIAFTGWGAAALFAALWLGSFVA